MSVAFRCGQCGEQPDWGITRIGDVVVSWACNPHLAAECVSLQRDFEVTQLVVTLYAKAVEVADINRTLDAIAREAL